MEIMEILNGKIGYYRAKVWKKRLNSTIFGVIYIKPDMGFSPYFPWSTRVFNRD